jgi:hypothetical protein
VLFVVRNPVERLYSQYKFAYNTYSKFGNFDDFIVPGMEFGQKYAELREMATNGTDTGIMLDYYYKVAYSKGGAIGALFMHSLYAFPIMHYARVLGAQNVKVVSAEDLDVHDPVRLYDTLNDVFTFIGICPFPIADLVPSLPTRNAVPGPNQMSQDMYARLTKFFKPFNTLLTQASGINTTSWDNKVPPAKLQKFNPRLNRSMPELWFETKERNALKKSSSIMSNLVPQR